MRNESFDFIAEGLIFLPYIYFDAQTSDYLVMITKKNNATNPITYFLGKIIWKLLYSLLSNIKLSLH